jgi:hypothetical protein
MSSESGEGLLNRILATEIKAEVLTLFHRNPGLIDSMEGIARRIGRRETEVEVDIIDFVNMGLLKHTQAGKTGLVSLNREKDDEVQAFLAVYLRSRTK